MSESNFDCREVHKNKLLYHPGDNPTQTQEMYWKQKNKCLKEKYNKPQQECNNYRTLIKSPLHGEDKLLDNHRWNGEERLDKDFYELKKLRLETRMNRVDCDTSPDNSVSSLSPVDGITFNLVLGELKVYELFKNNDLIDEIKYDVKDIVNKRLEDYFSAKYNVLTREKNFANNSSLIDNDSTNETTATNDEVAGKKCCKDNVTVLSKLKKVLRFKKSSSPDVNKKKFK